jgi:formiminotetrahydrofolate cyclodeaminase
MSLVDRSVAELVAAFRSPAPTPGGGSAAALAGAVGAALLAMVASLPRPRAAAPDDVDRLGAAGRHAGELSETLTALIDRDSTAYDAVTAAYRLPKASDDEKRVRSSAIQAALLHATDVPLEVMRCCAAALRHAPVVADLANANASSDVQVAVELLNAGVRGAKVNVEINLGSLKDAARVDQIRREVLLLSSES